MGVELLLGENITTPLTGKGNHLDGTRYQAPTQAICRTVGLGTARLDLDEGIFKALCSCDTFIRLERATGQDLEKWPFVPNVSSVDLEL